MRTLLEIKNTYAQEQGYADWRELRYWRDISGVADDYMNEICIRSQKAALEKAAENAYIHYPASNNLNPCVDETTITDPENLIR